MAGRSGMAGISYGIIRTMIRSPRSCKPRRIGGLATILILAGCCGAGLSSTAQQDRPGLVAQLDALVEVQKRWQGEKVFLDDEQLTGKIRAIAKRFDIDAPDVIVVKPALNKDGKPKPQRADAGIAWGVIDGKYHDVIFVTEYLKDGLSEAELLAALAHEMGHVSQAKNTGHVPKYIKGRKLEAEADDYALSCPEVDPAAFRSMILKVDKLNNAAGRAHPLLFGDITGSTAVIPISVQNDLLFGGDHPMSSARIKRANEEIKRRAQAAASPLQ